MLPLLKLSSDESEHSSKQAVDELADQFGLSKEEREAPYPGGGPSSGPVFYDRVHWALSYLKNAGLIDGTRRGFFKISQRGVDVLKQNPENLNIKFLKQFSEFNEFLNRSRVDKDEASLISPKDSQDYFTDNTPEEVLEDRYHLIRENLIRELLNNVKKSKPSFFEKLVVELLVAMGYGGSIKEAGQAIGKTGDEGIDGIIKEDLLGLDAIYLQAKKWDGTIGRPEIQKFAGALQGQRTKKGIFITTGKFSNDAVQYTRNIDAKIVLIDGNQLAEYMIENNIGVSDVKKYVIKNINSDYFEEQV